MKMKVTILDKDKNSPILDYEMEKEGDEYEKEVLEYQGKIARENRIPFRFQIVSREVIGLLLILCSVAVFSCRSVKKTSSRADSTAVRTVDSGSKWETEVVTEFIPFQQPVLAGDDHLFSFPQILNFSTAASSTMVEGLKSYGIIKKVAKKQEPPEAMPAGYYRQTLRTKGEQHSALAEKKTASIEQMEKQVESGIATSPVFSGLMIGLVVAFIAVVLVGVGIYKWIL